MKKTLIGMLVLAVMLTTVSAESSPQRTPKGDYPSGSIKVFETTPPEAIDDLTIALEDIAKQTTRNLFLQWTEPYDDTGVDRYVIYRSTDPTVIGDSLAGTSDTSYTDVSVAGHTGINYFYAVKAVDNEGNRSNESNRVGEFDRYLTNTDKGFGGYNHISWPLLPHDTAIQAVLADSLEQGCQLTGDAVPIGSDLVVTYDASTALWSTAWYQNSGPNAWKGTLTEIEADKSYWILIRDDHPDLILTMTGAVSDTHRIIPLQPGPSSNYVGHTYAVICSLGGPSGDDAELLGNGFTGAISPIISDQIQHFDGSNWYTAWYKTSGPGPSLIWKGWLSSSQTMDYPYFEPGNGYIIQVSEGHAFTDDQWVYPVPPDYSKSAGILSRENTAGGEIKSTGIFPHACFCYGGMDSSSYWALLDHSGTPLQDGDYVYAAWTGPDGQIDPPATAKGIGAPTDDDSLLIEGVIENGRFLVTATTWDLGRGHPEQGELIYCRIFDGPKGSLSPSNHYGDSQTFQVSYFFDEFVCLFPGDPGSGHTDTPIGIVIGDGTWTEMTSVSGPAARADHAMAPLGGDHVLLFGGRNGSTYDDTWIYHLSTNTWTQITPATSPSPKAMNAMAWLGGDRALMFEAIDIGPLHAKTWVYDLSETTWTQMNPSAAPSNRWEHAMAWIGGDQVLLFGGQDGDDLNDTWVYDLSEDSWTEKFPAASPAGGWSPGMAWIGGDQVLLFGGEADSMSDQTWVYDLSENTWTQMNPASKPSPRAFHAVEWMGDDQVLLFGGHIDTVSSDETWIYDLSENVWTQITPPVFPSLRHDHDMAWLGGEKILMFGGQCWVGDDTTYGDTWIFSSPIDTMPPEAIDDLSIALDNGDKSTSGDILLRWTEPSDDIGVDRYVIYRSTDPTTIGDSLAGTADTSYIDAGAAGTVGTNYFYVIKAADAAGNKSEESNKVGEFDQDLSNGTKAAIQWRQPETK